MSEHDEVELRGSFGNRWPEGDCRDHFVIDCCRECFEEKVKPAIEALGVRWREPSWLDSEGQPDLWAVDPPDVLEGRAS